MVSVVAIGPSLAPDSHLQGYAGGCASAQPPITYASRQHTRAPCVYAASHVPVFRAISPRFGFDIAWLPRARADAYDVIDVPSISEPDGSHGTVADRGRI